MTTVTTSENMVTVAVSDNTVTVASPGPAGPAGPAGADGSLSSSTLVRVEGISQAAYDALSPPVSTTVYFITS